MKGWIAAAVALCAACSKGSTSESTAIPTPTPTPSSSSSSTPASPTASVRLLDHGTEPLRPLHYVWRVDRKELMRIELTTTVLQGARADPGSGQKVVMPPLRITLAIDPQSLSPEGALRFAWHVLSAKADVDAGDAPPQVVAGWAQGLAPVMHLSGEAVVGADGVSKSVRVDTEAGPEAQMVVQVAQMVRDAAAPLPHEPVGKGARWERVSTLDARGGQATQTDTYTLVDLHGDVGKLDDVMAQTAPPQLLPGAGTAGGAQPRVDSFLSSARSDVDFDLGRIVAQSKLRGSTAMSLSADSRSVSMEMQLGVVVSGETR